MREERKKKGRKKKEKRKKKERKKEGTAFKEMVAVARQQGISVVQT